MTRLSFDKKSITARLILPSGDAVERLVQIRTHPITGRTCRIALSRTGQSEPGTDHFPEPPPDVANTVRCPFCRPQVESMTPMLSGAMSTAGRLKYRESILFPNMFPYGSHSAVSLFDNRHFVEIGTAFAASYADCLINCRNYLNMVLETSPADVYMAITQNASP